MHFMGQPTLAPRNRLLTALSPNDLARLWPQLEAVELPLHKVLHTPGEPIKFVYFPESVCVLVLSHTQDSDTDFRMIGHEGVVGLPILLGIECDDMEAIVRSPGTALRMNTQAFRESLEQIPGLRKLLLRYATVRSVKWAQPVLSAPYILAPAPPTLAAAGT